MSARPDLSRDVSRETLALLTEFSDLLIKWNQRINLVSASTIPDLWTRHIWDSAQLMEYAPDAAHWVDIGTGGGFPGVVLAIMAKDTQPELQFSFVESDQRKCAFLKTVIRNLNLPARVLSSRIEAIAPLEADVLSARALGHLEHLLGYADRHLASGGTALFMKGETWEKEVQTARDSWSFLLKEHKSKTNPAAAILEVKEIKRV